jgi:voltage-gated potassium channel
VRIGSSHFFGEMAVLKDAKRSATVTAATRANLLVLEAQDLRALMNREPRIAERIRGVIRERQAEQRKK